VLGMPAIAESSLAVLMHSAGLTQAAASAYVSEPAPPLTGKYAVGRREFVWTDFQRKEFGTNVAPGEHRRLVVWIWYPAAKSTLASAPALPSLWSNTIIR